jgi:hypothetical protein
MQFTITCYEVKKAGNNNWQEISEKMMLDKLADNFNQVTPIITKMLQGNEITAETEIYRIRS